MKRQYQITIEVSASTKENEQAFAALVAEAFETLKKNVAALNNVVTVKASVAEVSEPAPAAPVAAPPAAPAPPKV